MTIYVPGKVTLRQTYIGTDDPDAAAYIAAVEAADGEALETGVQVAIHSFVKGCKADGIWPALKASCILAGARTLDGALVPLVGTAPTKYNFVAGDYNRETGLVGDGSTKYLDSNHNVNFDPQNNHHLSIAITRNSNSIQAFIGGRQSAATSVGGKLLAYTTAPAFRSVPSDGALNTSGSLPSSVQSLMGFSRSNASNYIARVSGSNNTITSSSATPANANITVFGNNSSDGIITLSDARIAFYSIGESLDLALLDSRVTTLMSDIGVAIP